MAASKDLKPLAYYRWFWQDFRANRKVQRMTYIERGLYRELLDECWAEGGFHDSIELMAEICGCPTDVMASAWQVLGSCFVLSDGRWHNEKMDSVRTEKDRERVSKSRAGSKGGANKALNQKASVAIASNCLAVPGNCHIEEKRIEEEKHSSSADANDLKSGQQESEPIPIADFVSAYNEACGEVFPQVAKITENRKRRIRALWKTDTKSQNPRTRTDNLDYWRRYFAHCTRVKFFTAERSGTDHDNWRPDFDFLTSEKGYVGVLEGKYV